MLFSSPMNKDSYKEQGKMKTGFTLVESMVSIMLFGFLSLGVAQITMMALKISYHNVYKTTAYTVMQGYLEQIKSISNESLARAAVLSVSDPIQASNTIQTRSISLLSDTVSVDEIDDWLVPNTLDPDTLSEDLQVINRKQVVIDVDNVTGERIMMDIWVDVEIHRMTDTPGNVYLIDLQFIYEVPLIRGGTVLTRTVYTRNASRDYSTASSMMLHRSEFNEGRLQLVTSLLNFNSL